MLELVRIGETTNILGECPTWSPREGALYWIDVRRPALYRFDSGTKETRVWEMPETIGSMALSRSGRRLLLALKSSLSFFDPDSGKFELVAAPLAPELRFNDGRCDRQGRFWVGSMDDRTRAAVGSLYRVDATEGCVQVEGGVHVPNSLCWSPDGRTMYFGDSDLHTVFAYPYDPDSGSIGARRPFATTSASAVPDGATVDSEGFLWLTEYGGWRIVRYAPDGRLDREIRLPLQNPTSCAFGGARLDTLFVTTASQRLSPEELSRQPLAGALIAMDVGVRGLPEPAYAD
jgi:sugar lactone lactonase YvrE